MAYGAVPLAGAVGAVPQYLTRFATGAALPPHASDEFAAAIVRYVAEPARWVEESRRAVDAARYFSFAHYLEQVDALLAELDRSSEPRVRGSPAR